MAHRPTIFELEARIRVLSARISQLEDLIGAWARAHLDVVRLDLAVLEQEKKSSANVKD